MAINDLVYKYEEKFAELVVEEANKNREELITLDGDVRNPLSVNKIEEVVSVRILELLTSEENAFVEGQEDTFIDELLHMVRNHHLIEDVVEELGEEVEESEYIDRVGSLRANGMKQSDFI